MKKLFISSFMFLGFLFLITYPFRASASETDFFNGDVSSGNSLSISGGDISFDKDYRTDDEKKELSEKTEFSLFLEDLKELEKLAKKYKGMYQDENSVNLLISRYIRSGRYHDSNWQDLAGKTDTEFEAFVKEKNSSLENLKNIFSLTLPTGEKIDIVHMMATYNMYLCGYGALGGYGGDITQLALHIKSENGNLDELMEKVSPYILADGSYFNEEDFCADLDACNLYHLSSSNGLSLAMENYYKNLTMKKRIISFIDEEIKPDKYSKEGFRQSIYSKYQISKGIHFLRESYKMGSKTYDNHFKACVYIFSDYLYEVYEPISKNIFVEPVKDVNISENNKFLLHILLYPETGCGYQYSLSDNLYEKDGYFHFSKKGMGTITVWANDNPDNKTEIIIKGYIKNNTETAKEEKLDLKMFDSIRQILKTIRKLFKK